MLNAAHAYAAKLETSYEKWLAHDSRDRKRIGKLIHLPDEYKNLPSSVFYPTIPVSESGKIYITCGDKFVTDVTDGDKSVTSVTSCDNCVTPRDNSVTTP